MNNVKVPAHIVIIEGLRVAVEWLADNDRNLWTQVKSIFITGRRSDLLEFVELQIEMMGSCEIPDWDREVCVNRLLEIKELCSSWGVKEELQELVLKIQKRKPLDIN